MTKCGRRSGIGFPLAIGVGVSGLGMPAGDIGRRVHTGRRPARPRPEPPHVPCRPDVPSATARGRRILDRRRGGPRPHDDPGPGAWAGGPSAQLVDGTWWLAYRLRRPIGQGRGFANVVARSDDGVSFTPVVELGKDDFGAESLGNPPWCTRRTARGGSTSAARHRAPGALARGRTGGRFRRRPGDGGPAHVLPGNDTAAVKDPVLRHDGDQWHLWASVHPLDDPDATDRMTTEHATSPDGVDWTWRGAALAGREGHWDARGVQFAAVVLDGSRTGRCTTGGRRRRRTGRSAPAWPWPTRAGSARWATSRCCRVPTPPFGLRYCDVVSLPDGRGPLVLRRRPGRRCPRAAHRRGARLNRPLGGDEVC